MNIAALQTFLAVVQMGNLNKAAEQLNVTQSTVTARLDVLEETLGQKLLVRSRRGAELTKAGFVFQRHAELVTQAWDQARKAVGLPRGFSGMFSFACHFDFWDGAGAAWLETVRFEQPDLALEAWSGDVADIRRWLSSGLIDAAMVPEPLSGAELLSAETGQDRLVQVSTRARAAVDWDPAYIYVDLGSEFRRQHSLAWPGDETAHMTFGASQWALDYLLEKGGSAYLPWRLTEELVREGRLHPVDGSPEFSRARHLTWRKASLAAHPWIEEMALRRTGPP
jgi:DNA-binding transcriptional LysR family regulator